MSEKDSKKALFSTPEQIMELTGAFMRSRIFLTSYELGVFDVIGKSKMSSDAVSDSIGADKRATNRLLNSLVAMGILKKQDDEFSIQKSISGFLIEGEPEYMGMLGHYLRLWETWSNLTDSVKAGTSVSNSEVNDWGEKNLKAFIKAMHWRAKNTASELVSHIDLDGVSKMLDVGGGSGVYSMAFIQAKDDLTSKVFDLPNVIPLTKKYVSDAGLSDRIGVLVGDYNVDDFESGFDLALLSAIIHANSPEQNIELIQKCADALNPGGQIVISDFIMDEDRTTPGFGAIFSLNMLVATDGGDTYTEDEVKNWFEKAGITSVSRKDTRSGATLLIGRK
ncbi:MAG: methyltransferase [bacterium]